MLDINNSVNTGTLTVNLDDPTASGRSTPTA